MTYTVRMRGVVVGHSELEGVDASMGIARGVFGPAMGYELVQPIFRLYSEAVPESSASPTDENKLQRYYRARDALGLELVNSAGRVVATSAIHIYDYSLERGSDALELEVTFTDAVSL